MRGVVALDVEGRVGLGVAQLLRVLEALGKRDALVAHAGEDVVAGAVHDAVDARDAGRAEPLAQRLDHRDAAGHRRLEAELGARFLGQPGERHAVPGKQRLVGGDHRAADLERGLHRGERRAVLAADQLDEEVDAVRFGQRHRDRRTIRARSGRCRGRASASGRRPPSPRSCGRACASAPRRPSAGCAPASRRHCPGRRRRSAAARRLADSACSCIALRMRVRVSERGSRPSRRSKTNSGSPAMVRPKRVGVQPRAAMKASTAWRKDWMSLIGYSCEREL